MTLCVYAEIGSNFQQVGGDCPNGWIQMNGQRPDDKDTLLYTASEKGEWVISDRTLLEIRMKREADWACLKTLTLPPCLGQIANGGIIESRSEPGRKGTLTSQTKQSAQNGPSDLHSPDLNFS
jgi:hypothetical protein